MAVLGSELLKHTYLIMYKNCYHWMNYIKKLILMLQSFVE